MWAMGVGESDLEHDAVSLVGGEVAFEFPSHAGALPHPVVWYI